jgi:hypothetical protein
VSTLEGFLKVKQARKENTIEAALHPIITNLVSQHGKELLARDIWDAITEGNLISGHYDVKRPNEYQTADYGTIYRNSITNVICDKLGAQKKHKETGSVLIFDIDKLVKIGKTYELETHVQLKLLEGHKPDSSDGFSKTLTTSKENHNIEITNNDGNRTNISEGNPDNHVNNTADKNENPSVIPIKSSEPSEPSAIKVNNENGKPTTISALTANAATSTATFLVYNTDSKSLLKRVLLLKQYSRY